MTTSGHSSESLGSLSERPGGGDRRQRCGCGRPKPGIRSRKPRWSQRCGWLRRFWRVHAVWALRRAFSRDGPRFRRKAGAGAAATWVADSADSAVLAARFRLGSRIECGCGRGDGDVPVADGRRGLILSDESDRGWRTHLCRSSRAGFRTIAGACHCCVRGAGDRAGESRGSILWRRRSRRSPAICWSGNGWYL